MSNNNLIQKQYNTFMACETDFAPANIVLFGAPYDSSTSSRPGGRFGSAAIRTESYGLETYSPYQDKDLTDCQICDAGDLELPFGDSEQPWPLLRILPAKLWRPINGPLCWAANIW